MHNSGVALIEASAAHGIRLLANDEEERFAGKKHCDDFPVHALDILKTRLGNLGVDPDNVDAWLTSWDFISLPAMGLKCIAEEFPASLRLARRDAMPLFDGDRVGTAVRATPARLKQHLGLKETPALIAMPHHDNHAAFSWAVSPFRDIDEPVMVTVLDGFGDEGGISTYVAEQGKLNTLSKNFSFVESLGLFYSVISSTQGGWTPLSSEGRFMGAAAWGDGDRMTNPFYRGLRQLFYFGTDGQIALNRSMANWHVGGLLAPYKAPLTELIGQPILPDGMWNPDAVLNVDDIEHSPQAQRRADVAAATQLVFEDALFHIVDALIRRTGSSHLVMTGGTALNCLANMNLLERFDRGWFNRNLGIDATLKLWVPPVPGDAGVAAGAGYQFALAAGARAECPLRHAYHCGMETPDGDIVAALEADEAVSFMEIGNVLEADGMTEAADLLASLVAEGSVVGLFQGRAETGPRALGNRSILADPSRRDTLQMINEKVKRREPYRPLAPMLTLEAARELYFLQEGVEADDFQAYEFMVLTARARPETRDRIPAVVHRDGTSRLQIVRPEVNPFCHAYLKAMGRKIGVEVSVNTSLNVASPIVQTPLQAIGALRRAIAMDALLMISQEGIARLIWENESIGRKDGGRALQARYDAWRGENRPAGAALGR